MRLLIVALLVCSAAPAAARVRFRLGPELRAGVSVESDLFVGAQAGGDLSFFAAPSLRLDVAFTPGSRLFTSYTAGLGRYLNTSLTSITHNVSTEWRHDLFEGGT